MKKIILLIMIVLVCCACSAKTDEEAPVAVVEQFYNALVTQNRDQISTIVCADWEKDALREVDAFMGVKSEMQDFKCSVQTLEGDNAVVTCEGKIAATYGNEISDFPLSGRTHQLVKQDGEWLVCGY